MKMTILIVFMFAAKVFALDCDQIQTGYQLSKTAEGLRIENCFQGAIDTDYLLRALDKFKNDSEFVGALKRIEVGDDVDSMYKNIRDIGDKTYLIGASSDRMYMEYILTKLNSIEEARYADSRKRKEDEERRKLKPLNVKLSDLAAYAEANESTAHSIINADCTSESALTNKMKAVQVNFEDGTSQSFIPLKARKVSSTQYEFEILMNESDLQKSVRSGYRTLKFLNEKFIWVSYYGKEYPIHHFSEIKSDEEAIGMEGGLNNPQNMVCRYQRFLKAQRQHMPSSGTSVK